MDPYMCLNRTLDDANELQSPSPKVQIEQLVQILTTKEVINLPGLGH